MSVSRLLPSRFRLLRCRAIAVCPRGRCLTSGDCPGWRARGAGTSQLVFPHGHALQAMRHLSTSSSSSGHTSSSAPTVSKTAANTAKFPAEATSTAPNTQADRTVGRESQFSSVSLGQLWSMLRPERLRLQLAFGAMCASSSVSLSYPYLMGHLVDIFGNQEGGLEFVMDHVMHCGAVILAGGLATFCRLYLVETAVERVSYRLRREFFSALLHREIPFFDANKTGELITRLSNDITVTSRILIDCSAGFRSLVTACVGTCMVFHLAPSEMMAGLLGPVAALFLVGVGYGRLVRRIAERRQQRLAEAVQLADERLSGIRTVRTFNAEPLELRGFEGMLEHVYAAGRQNAIATGGLSALFVSGGGLFLLHIIYNCGMMVTSGVVSIGTTVSLGMYCLMAGSSYTGMMTAYGDIQKSLGACSKVLDIVQAGSAQSSNAPPERSAVERGAAAFALGDVTKSQPLEVKLENVSFAYPSQPGQLVMDGFSLDIPAGSRVALLGRSGCGKSTVASLVVGLYAPTTGRVLVDGVDIAADPAGAALARGQIGVISQDPTLFTLSIRENVEYGLGSAGTAEAEAVVQDAIRAAHVDEFSSKLPLGLGSPVGESGNALSGGQRQRVCIARALARRPRMLIFDEATSALDLRSEQLVHKALHDIFESEACTCLVITHRLSALQWVNRVAVVDGGRVVQYGPRDEVMANPGIALRNILHHNLPAGGQ